MAGRWRRDDARVVRCLIGCDTGLHYAVYQDNAIRVAEQGDCIKFDEPVLAIGNRQDGLWRNAACDVTARLRAGVGMSVADRGSAIARGSEHSMG